MTKPSGKDEWYADRRIYKQPKYRVKYMRGRTREDRLVAYAELVLSTMEGAMKDDARGYVQGQEARGVRLGSRAMTACMLRSFVESLPTKTLDTLTPEDLEHAITVYSKDRKPSSIATFVRVVHALLNWHFQEAIPKLLRRSVRRKTPKPPERRPLSRAEFETLIEHASKQTGNANPARSVALLWLLWDSGMRVSEALSLRRSSVARDPEGGMTLTMPEKAFGLKTGARTVYVIECVPYVEAWMRVMPSKKPDAPLFCQLKAGSRTMLPGNVANLLTNLSTAAKMRHVHPHLLRHTRATRAAEAGWNEFEMNAYFGATGDSCFTDRIEALQPRHVNGKWALNWSTDPPMKAVPDVLDYVMHVMVNGQDVAKAAVTGDSGEEDMTHGRGHESGYVCNILCSLPDLASDAASLVTNQLPAGGVQADLAAQSVLQTAGVATDFVTDNSIMDIQTAVPFMTMSFEPAAQEYGNTSMAMSTPRSNYLYLDETRLAGFNGTNLVITETWPSVPSPSFVPAGTGIIQGQYLPPANETTYRPLVAAHGLTLGGTLLSNQTTLPQNDVGLTAAVFLGNGEAGTGLVIQINAAATWNQRGGQNQTSLLTNLSVDTTVPLFETAWGLGGNRTYDADCGAVALYSYVAPYFRCHGYSQAANGVLVQGNATTGDCYNRALDFVTTALSTASNTSRNMTEPTFQDPLLQGELSVPTWQGPLNPTDVAQSTATAHLAQTSLSWDAWNLTTCNGGTNIVTATSALGGAPNVFVYDLLQGFVQGTQDNMPAASQYAAASVGDLQPGLAAGGEASSLLTVGVAFPDPTIQTDVSTHAAVPVAGPQNPLGFTYDVSQWTTNLVNAWLNESGPSGQSSLAIAPPYATLTDTMAMPAGRSSLTADVANGNVYILGGYTPSGAATSVLAYNPQTNTYSTVGTTGSNIVESSSVWDGNEIVLVGGSDAGIRKFDVTLGVTTDTGNSLPYDWTFNTAGQYGTASVFDGTNVLIFGGNYGNSLERVDAYNPVTNVLTQRSSTCFAYPISYAAAVYDGHAAYLFGGLSNPGGHALNTIWKYDPSANRCSLMGSTFPTAFAGGSAIWDGSRAVIYANGDIYSYDPAHDLLLPLALGTGARGGTAAVALNNQLLLLGGSSGVVRLPNATWIQYGAPAVPFVPDTTFTTSIPLTDGNRYTLSLEAVDDQGNHFANRTTFLSDATPPTIWTNLNPVTYWGSSSIGLSFSATDSGVGMGTLQIDEKIGSGNWVRQSTSTGNGASIVVNLNPTGMDGQVEYWRATATDAIGNSVSSTVQIVFDFTPPSLSGHFLNLADGVNISSVYLNASTTATDSGSGLASLSVEFDNDTASIPVQSWSFNGDGSATVTSGISNAWPGDQYSLYATATDRAGNSQRVGPLAQALINLSPVLSPVLPSAGSSNNFSRVAPFAAFARLLTVSSLNPDWTTFDIYDANGNFVNEGAVSSSQFNRYTLPLGHLANGAYSLNMSSVTTMRHKTGYSWMNASFSVADDPASAPANLDSYMTYGEIDSINTTAMYHFQQDPICGLHFTLAVNDTNPGANSGLHFYLRDASDGALPTISNSREFPMGQLINFQQSQATNTEWVLITSDTNSGTFSIRHTYPGVTCTGGSSGRSSGAGDTNPPGPPKTTNLEISN